MQAFSRLLRYFCQTWKPNTRLTRVEIYGMLRKVVKYTRLFSWKIAGVDDEYSRTTKKFYQEKFHAFSWVDGCTRNN